jgi:hypothetical protein
VALQRVCERVAFFIAVVLGEAQRMCSLALEVVVLIEMGCVEHYGIIRSRETPTRRYVDEGLLSKR